MCLEPVKSSCARRARLDFADRLLCSRDNRHWGKGQQGAPQHPLGVVVRVMREGLLGREAQSVDLPDHRQELTYNLRRAFPLAGRGEFDELLAVLDKLENKHK